MTSRQFSHRRASSGSAQTCFASHVLIIIHLRVPRHFASSINGGVSRLQLFSALPPQNKSPSPIPHPPPFKDPRFGSRQAMHFANSSKVVSVRKKKDCAMAGSVNARLTRRQMTNLGRSGPRSKTGCQTCKIRRVRCDETRPCCGHCSRLKLDCVYMPPRPRQSQRRQTSAHVDDGGDEGMPEDPEATTASQTPEPTLLEEVATTVAVQKQPSRSLAMQQDTISLPATMTMQPTPASTQGNTEPSFLDALSHAASTAAPVDTSTAANAITEFSEVIHGGGGVRSFQDYAALPDPTFPFTSFAFTGSIDPAEAAASCRGVHTFFDTNSSNLPLFSGHSPDINVWDPTLNLSGSQTSLSQGVQGGTPNSTWPSFTVSPPLLSHTQEESLLDFFQNDIRPPASLVGVDPLGWSHIRNHVLQMAKQKRESVLHAIYALSTLLTASSTTIRLGINRDDHIIFASRLHEATCAAIHLGISHPGWEKSSCQELLVSIFLLAWFEAAYDEDNLIRPPFPAALAENIIVNGKQWDSQICHVFQWLHMLDAKSSHLGGHHLLSEAALIVLRDSRPSCAVAESIVEPLEETTSSNTVESRTRTAVPNSTTGSSHRKSTTANRLSYMLSSGTNQTLPTQIIRMDLFNILLQPAFEFHMESQAYCRRVGCYDRHHRSRGTPDDEFEIMSACMGFEEELQDLWKRRPGILSLNADQLKEFVSPDLAQRLEQLFSVYLATFWCHFVYIHRVAFWNMEHTPIVKKALEQIGNMMRRSVGQPMDQLEFDTSIDRSAHNTVHPGLMWTCFLFGCEVREPIQERWSVQQLGALGKLRNNRSGGAPGAPAELLGLGLDEKGARNALKLSRLLQHLTERQAKLCTRVDGKYLCQELFGCYLYII